MRRRARLRGRAAEHPAQDDEADQPDRSRDDGDHDQLCSRTAARHQCVEPPQGRSGRHHSRERQPATLPLRPQPGHPATGAEGEPAVEFVGQCGGGDRAGEVGGLTAEIGQQDEQRPVQEIGDRADGHEADELRPPVIPAEPVQQPGDHLLCTSVWSGGAERFTVCPVAYLLDGATNASRDCLLRQLNLRPVSHTARG